MPNSGLRDRFVYLYLTLMLDSFSCIPLMYRRLNYIIRKDVSDMGVKLGAVACQVVTPQTD